MEELTRADVARPKASVTCRFTARSIMLLLGVPLFLSFTLYSVVISMSTLLASYDMKASSIELAPFVLSMAEVYCACWFHMAFNIPSLTGIDGRELSKTMVALSSGDCAMLAKVVLRK